MGHPRAVPGKYVGATKGEIASYEQFSLLKQCFQKSSAAMGSESLCMRERVK